MTGNSPVEVALAILPCEGKFLMREPTTLWKKVGALASAAGSFPRHSFSLVTEGDVCWLIGGFDGKKIIKFGGFVSHQIQ